MLQLLQHTTSPELCSTWIVWRSTCSQQTPCYSLNKSRAPPQLHSALWLTRRSWASSHRGEPCCHHSMGKSRSKNMYSLLQLSGVGGKTFRHKETRLQSFLRTFKAGRKNAFVSPSNHSHRRFPKAQVQLQHLCHRHFNSSQLSHPRVSDACKPGHPTRSAEPTGNQRTAAVIKRAANFLPSY